MNMFPQNENSTNHHQIHIVSCQELGQLLESSQAQPRSQRHGRKTTSRGQIHRVPPQLRLKKNENYDPQTVSLGPYHHGKPELHQAQQFKSTSLDWLASGSDENKTLFYNKILEIIDDVRGCYADVSIVDKYDDKALALMMLLDACFIINFMETRTRRKSNFHEWRHRLGTAVAMPFTFRDIMLLENQIPFHVIKLLIGFTYGEEEGQDLIHRFVGWMIMAKSGPLVRIPGEEQDPPLHILEACWRAIVGGNSLDNKSRTNQEDQIAFDFGSRRLMKKYEGDDQNNGWTSQTGRSVMDLKAKGIKFRPSSSTSITDIKFKSFAFHGQLQLPVRYVSESTRVILSNLIAYEISPNSHTDLAVLSYTSFMKSLIQSPSDVKELHEKGILCNKFSNNEEVVKIIKEIDTFGLVNFNIFEDVKHRLNEHCKNKAKTWMADLIHTRFRSPWTVIALLATTFLICLTFLQTYFTIHPAKVD